MNHELLNPREVDDKAEVRGLIAGEQMRANNRLAMRGRVQIKSVDGVFLNLTIVVIDRESDFVVIHEINETIDFLPLINSLR